MKYVIRAFCWLAIFFSLINVVGAGVWFLIGLFDRTMVDTASTYVAEGILVGGMWALFLLACNLGRYVAENYTICRRN